MNAHYKWKHLEKNLACDYCEYRCVSLNFLREHVRVQHTHRNIKPYKCAYCDYHCAVSGNCRKHVMNRHKGLPVKWEKVCDKWGPKNDRPVLGVEMSQPNSFAHNMDLFNQSIDRIIAESSVENTAAMTIEYAGSGEIEVAREVVVPSVPAISDVEVSVPSYSADYQTVPRTQDANSIITHTVQPTEQSPPSQQQQQQQPVLLKEAQGQNQLLYRVYQTDQLVIPGQHDYSQNVYYQIQ